MAKKTPRYFIEIRVCLQCQTHCEKINNWILEVHKVNLTDRHTVSLSQGTLPFWFPRLLKQRVSCCQLTKCLSQGQSQVQGQPPLRWRPTCLVAVCICQSVSVNPRCLGCCHSPRLCPDQTLQTSGFFPSILCPLLSCSLAYSYHLKMRTETESKPAWLVISIH